MLQPRYQFPRYDPLTHPSSDPTCPCQEWTLQLHRRQRQHHVYIQNVIEQEPPIKKILDWPCPLIHFASDWRRHVLIRFTPLVDILAKNLVARYNIFLPHLGLHLNTSRPFVKTEIDLGWGVIESLDRRWLDSEDLQRSRLRQGSPQEQDWTGSRKRPLGSPCSRTKRPWDTPRRFFLPRNPCGHQCPVWMIIRLEIDLCIRWGHHTYFVMKTRILFEFRVQGFILRLCSRVGLVLKPKHHHQALSNVRDCMPTNTRASFTKLAIRTSVKAL